MRVRVGWGRYDGSASYMWRPGRVRVVERGARGVRFIHTADWHLGRSFHNDQLTDDQSFTLDGLVALAGERDVDAIVVAGDVFDRAVPPTQAVELLGDVLGRLVLDLDIPVVMIAGNHDSPVRLEYMSELVWKTGLHTVGQVAGVPRSVTLAGAQFWPLAYTDPETARCELGRDDIHTHDEALAAQLDAVRAAMDPALRQVLVGHAFVTGADQSESERPLTVGGTGSVDSALFEGFDYVALGHLHRPQAVGAPHLRYSGSLLKYSFDEAEHRKSVTVVDLGDDGAVSVEEVELPIRHDLRRVRGSIEELLATPPPAEVADAYVEVMLTNTDPVLDPVDKLRPFYPNLVSLRREQADSPLTDGAGAARVRDLTPVQLFDDFFEDVTGAPISEEQHAEVVAVLEQMGRAAQEMSR
jgi:exonuclease SbcD